MRKKTHFFGDARLLDSFRFLVEALATQMTVIIRRLSKLIPLKQQQMLLESFNGIVGAGILSNFTEQIRLKG